MIPSVTKGDLELIFSEKWVTSVTSQSLYEYSAVKWDTVYSLPAAQHLPWKSACTCENKWSIIKLHAISYALNSKCKLCNRVRDCRVSFKAFSPALPISQLSYNYHC